MSKGRLIHFVLPNDSINDLQLEDLRKVIERAKHAHMTDIDMRINGKNEHYEADWLKHFQEVAGNEPVTDGEEFSRAWKESE